MSAPAAIQTGRPQSGGCLKCGETGHWARDCQAPREKWLPRNGTQDGPAARTGAEMATDPAANLGEGQENAPAPTLAATRQQKPRPKLTFEMLKKSSGLPEVYHNFPATFRQQFRGKGHEATDLRRLLEMYKRWQDRVFPHGSFDNFISTVEKMSSSHIVTSELQAMRTDLVKGVDDYLSPTEQRAREDAEPQGAGRPAAADDNDDLELAIDYDDELLELAAAPMDVAADVGTVEGDLEIDDDELLELAMQGEPEAGVPVQEREHAEDDEIDDDELLEMAMQS